MSAQELKPRADTIRYVEWDELPPSVKEIPAGLNPIAGGVLMKHQAEWCAIQASIKLASKGRRTGITFAEALDDTLIAGSQKKAGGDNVYYIPDTKDKGLEFIGYCAHFARVIAEAQSSGISRIEEFLFEDQDEDGSTRMINAYRIRFSSGFSIVALSSRPANIRGLQGIVVIDEAAFHQNVAAVLEAADDVAGADGAVDVPGGVGAHVLAHDDGRHVGGLIVRAAAREPEVVGRPAARDGQDQVLPIRRHAHAREVGGVVGARRLARGRRHRRCRRARRCRRRARRCRPGRFPRGTGMRGSSRSAGPRR